MKKYQFLIVKYIHDRFTGEFVNVGIIVFQAETGFLKSRFVNKFSRISQFFKDVNGQHLLTTLKHFEKEILKLEQQIAEMFFNYKNLSEICNAILVKDDSALECSELKQAIDVSPKIALDDLFDRYVAKYITEPEKEATDDKQVWKNIYKQYFDEYGITENLRPHVVETQFDMLEFEKSWKNGIWHSYVPLSFDLKRSESIKNKVYKWSGILNELGNSKEPLHLYILTARTSKFKSLNTFIDETLVQRSSSSLQISIIHEEQAETLAKEIGKEIQQHNNE